MVKTKIIKVDLNFPNEAIPNPDEINLATTAPEVEVETKKPAKRLPKKPLEATPVEVAEETQPIKAVEEAQPIEVDVVEESSPVEVVEEVKTPEKLTKAVDKVKCQYCNKEMSSKSLKYSHARNCVGLKQTIEKVTNEKVEKIKQLSQ